MRKIPLTQGKHAIVDDGDFAVMSVHKWQAYKHKRCHVWYARRQSPRPNRKTILMHRLILGAKKGQMIDHKNGNGLDNRQNNLRFCTLTQQRLNCKISSKYGFRGIHFSPKSKKNRRWYACVKVKGKQFTLGSYATAIEAAKAFDQLAPKYMGTLYRPNFPKK